MGDRHHYDKFGNYRGYSSDDGPNYWLGLLVVIFFAMYLLGGC